MKTKTFTKIAKENGFDFDDLNDEKFSTIKDYEVDIYKSHKKIGFVDNLDHPELTDINTPEYSIYRNDDSVQDITFCYTVWQNPMYIKFLYLSFLSQLLYSDLLNVKKFVIITDYKLEELVWDVFRPFAQDHSNNFSLEVIAIDRQRIIWSNVSSVRQPARLNKYIISQLDELRETDLLILSDCESFLYGQRNPIFYQIQKKYNENNDDFPVVGCREIAEDGESIFLKRGKKLANMMVDNEEYVIWCSKRLNISPKNFIDKVVKRNDWYLTCWFVYDKNKYRINDKNWKKYIDWANLYSIYCDETIYLTYAWCRKNYDVKDISYFNNLRFIHSHECEKFVKQFFHSKKNVNKEDFELMTGIIHPLHGKYESDFWVQDFYTLIQEEFNQKLKEAMNKATSFRDLLPQYDGTYHKKPYVPAESKKD